MEDLLYYILPAVKAIIVSLMLLLIYYILWQHKGSYTANRIILLSIPIFAVVFSVLQIEIYTPEPVYITLSQLNEQPLIENDLPITKIENSNQDQNSLPLSTWLIIFYLLGCLYGGMKIFLAHHNIMNLKSDANSDEYHNNGISIYRCKKVTSPFSYGNMIFIPTYLHGDKLQAVLKHEYEHITHNHHYDLLTIEILATVLWFNPIMLLIKRELKKIHEFQADSGVIKQNSQIDEYQTYLLEVFTQNKIRLVNEFNNSTIKQRFIEMKNKQRGSIGFAGKSISCIALAIIFALNTFAFGEQQTIITTTITQTDTVCGTITEKSDMRIVDTYAKKMEEPYRLSNTNQPDSNMVVKDSNVTVVGIALNNSKGNPLYVIDGIIYESYNFDKLDPNSIESIDVLKDTNNIFGDTGHDEVIVITTKKETTKQDIPATLLSKISALDNTLKVDSTIFIIGERTSQKAIKHDLKWIQLTTNKPSLFLIKNRVYSVNLLTDVFTHIDESQIKGITILKDDAAVETFGVIPGSHVVIIDYSGKIDDKKVFGSFDPYKHFGARINNKWGKRSVKQIHKKANPEHI